jgi:response regulator RpfG family c-di-GMP phosphodiesterase
MPPDREPQLDGVFRLIDALNCGAFIVNRAGLICHANHRLCEMLRVTLEAVVGYDPVEFYESPQARDFLKTRRAEFDQAFEGEFFLPRAGAEDLPIILSGRPISSSPPLNEYRLMTVIDISGQKRAEAMAREEFAQLSRMSDTVIEQALELKHYSETLERRVRERTAEIHQANMESIYMLAVASEAKDADTGAHVRRIQHYTQTLAERLGIPEEIAERYGYLAILHDVGKMQVADQILKKPAPLTSQERADMQTHTLAGERILSREPFFEVARKIARSHHENWDGTGYPDGLAGENIPEAARIVHLADVYDALVSERVYKPAWSRDQAMAAITSASGKLFDPRVVEAFSAVMKDGAFERLGQK